MKTPISDFLRDYAKRGGVRMHMPGHKGSGGIEKYDITEIQGADSLYEASGVIRESEINASALFGSHTFYSTEGSSLAIRAMLYLATLEAKERGARPLILAGRNAHKVLVGAAALLDLDIEWLAAGGTYMSCLVGAEDVALRLEEMKEKPIAVYLTSPDYLGNTVDIGAIARVCHERGVLLLVDNAHGAYLKFLSPSGHPIDLGADMCADSAHKTLPVLTGGAYLHISRAAKPSFKNRAKDAMALFASTSPSYLILDSLDRANEYIADGFVTKLTTFVNKIDSLKQKYAAFGFAFVGDEKMKITIDARSMGYSGYELRGLFAHFGIEVEFADPDFLVIMPSVSNTDADISSLESAMSGIVRRHPIKRKPPSFTLPERAMSPREAILSPSVVLPLSECVGRVLASVTVGCPPAVPILVSGEVIPAESIKMFEYYGIEELRVVVV